MHTMPMDSDGFPGVVVTNIYNESLLIGDNESRARGESIDGVEGMESLSIYCLTRYIYGDNLKE